ncbi:FAD:protein FMN transferase [Solemya velum gill symbiont]|nr:FAD:protein FMN transferase [Solemya velum gill symbiont]
MKTSCSMILADKRHRITLTTTGRIMLAVVSLFLLASCSSERQAIKLSGSTMGTGWSVKYWSDETLPDKMQVQQSIQSQLNSFEQMMSTYRADSDITQFNHSNSVEWQQVPAELAEVTSAALEISALTDGAYDITVEPLVELWGFGPVETNGKKPSVEEIDLALRKVGYRKLSVNQNLSQLRKSNADLSIDLSSIAKGYAVDRVAQQLNALGIPNYMLEVGGELITMGRSHRGNAWRIAIEKPVDGMQSVQLVISPDNMGVATSGDYRNYFEDDAGMRFSHTIDPITGLPVKNRMASVTVIMPSVMLADGYATALMALGPDKAMELAEKNRIAAYFIIRNGKELHTEATSAFAKYIHGEEQ